MILSQRAYPFTRGLSTVRRGTWRPVDKWVAPDDRPPSRAGAALNVAEALADPQIPPDLRNRTVGALMNGGAFARNVADEVSEMVDDDRVSPAIGAAILRAIDLKPSQVGDVQASDGSGGDNPIGNPPDAWGAPWMGGGRPANPDYAVPSLESGYLYPPRLKSSRMGHGLAKRSKRSTAELRRICELIEASPDGVAPDMKKIEAIVARELRQGLLRA
jgi:hypothetical protein